MKYSHEEIIKALTVISETCADNHCRDCPFCGKSESINDCKIGEGLPSEWEINSKTNLWRALL